MQLESFDQIDEFASEVLRGIDQVIERKFITSILNVYSKFCRGEGQRLDIHEQPITKETHLRLRFECLCFCVCVACFHSSKKYLVEKKWFITKRSPERIAIFEGGIALALVALCENTGMNKLREITVSLDINKGIIPDTIIGRGDQLDPLNRLNEYRSAFLRMDKGISGNLSPIEIYGKSFGKTLDAQHYTLLEILGWDIGKKLPEVAVLAVDSIYMGVFNSVFKF